MTDTADRRREVAVVGFAHSLVSAVLNRTLHGRDSRFVVEAMQELVQKLADAAAAGVEMPLPIQFDGNRLCYDGAPLRGPSLQARPLLERCAHHRIAVLAFDPGLGADEANRLFDLLLLPQNDDAFERDNREAAMFALGVRHVRATRSEPARLHDDDSEGHALQRYQDLATALQHNHGRALHDQELAFDEASAAIERTLREFDEPSLLLALSMQDEVDRFTVGHSVRVALLALQVARAAGASREQLLHIGSAALMHDIGKSKVPQEILFKQGRLDPDEWAVMMQHPRLGAQILIEQHEEVDPRTVGAAFCHHMGADGGGYPDAVLPIHPCATSRLIRVCDVFEALTAVRPYKHALTPIEAYAVMFRGEAAFDPQWLRRFVRTLGLFPVGTRVDLGDGASAVVVGQTDDMARPRVRLLTGVDGADLPADHPETIRVGEALEGAPTSIRGIETFERFVPLPELDDDGAGGDACPARHAHDACLGPHDHEPPA